MGYETAARIAREAIVTGTPVRELILRDEVLTRDQLEAILDPFAMTRPGIAGAKRPKDEYVWKDQTTTSSLKILSFRVSHEVGLTLILSHDMRMRR